MSLSAEEEKQYINQGKGKQIDPDETRYILSLFAKYDTDGNGELSRDELQPLLKKIFGKKNIKENILERWTNTYFTIADTDKSGNISRSEFFTMFVDNVYTDLDDQQKDELKERAKIKGPSAADISSTHTDDNHNANQVNDTTPSENNGNGADDVKELSSGEENQPSTTTASTAVNNHKPLISDDEEAGEDESDKSPVKMEDQKKDKDKNKPGKPNGTQSANVTPRKPPTPNKVTPTRPASTGKGKSPQKTPIRNITLGAGDTFSPSISPHPSYKNRSGDVFDKLYQDAVQRRQKLKQKQDEAKAVVNKQQSPEVSKYASKTTRTKNVFEALYADAEQRREKRKNNQ